MVLLLLSNYNKNIFILLKANVFILLCLSVCLGVFLFASLLPINVETAEPIELKILEVILYKENMFIDV